MTDAAAAGGAEQVMRTARVIQASPQTLFQLLTGSDAGASWRGRTSRGTLSGFEMDARVGGGFRYSMTVNGVEQEASGRFLEISPPNRFVTSWTWATGNDEIRDGVVTVELKDMNDGTCRAVVTQQKLPSRNAAAMQAALWSNVLQDLAIHVVSAS
jgi:uncharacterized protein YndB with AHSA1/START domain